MTLAGVSASYTTASASLQRCRPPVGTLARGGRVHQRPPRSRSRRSHVPRTVLRDVTTVKVHGKLGKVGFLAHQNGAAERPPRFFA